LVGYFNPILKRISLLLALSLAFALRASAISFTFQFDSDPTPGIQSPLVGTGTFTFANDPGIGTFAFNSLGAFAMVFNFTNGDSFSQANITSDLSQVFVVLTNFGAGRRLQFSDDGDGSGGTFVGSLDFVNGPNGLSFEPSYAGQGLRLYFESSLSFGDYLATNGVSAPEGGSTVTLTLLALAAVLGLHRLLRGRSAAM
jgi:hypothetical protein